MAHRQGRSGPERKGQSLGSRDCEAPVMNHLQRLLPSLRTGDPGDIRGRFALRLTILVDLPEKLRAIKIDPEPPRGPRDFGSKVVRNASGT